MRRRRDLAAVVYLAAALATALELLVSFRYEPENYAIFSIGLLLTLFCASILAGWYRTRPFPPRLRWDPLRAVHLGSSAVLLAYGVYLAVQVRVIGQTGGRAVVWSLLAGLPPIVLWYGLPRRRVGEVMLGVLIVFGSPLMQVEALRNRNPLFGLALFFTLHYLAEVVLKTDHGPPASGRFLAGAGLLLAATAASTAGSVYFFASLRVWLLLARQVALGLLIWGIAPPSRAWRVPGLAAGTAAAAGVGLGLALALRRVAVLGLAEGLGRQFWPAGVPPENLIFFVLAGSPVFLVALAESIGKRPFRRLGGIFAGGVLAYLALAGPARVWLMLAGQTAVYIGLRRAGRAAPALRRRWLAATAAAVLAILVASHLAVRASAPELRQAGRHAYWQAAASRPLLGLGFEVARLRIPIHLAENAPYFRLPDPDAPEARSLAAELAAAGGIAGLAAGIVFLGLAFAGAAGQALAGRKPVRGAAAAAGLTAVLLEAVASSRPLGSDAGFLVFVLASLALPPSPSARPQLRRLAVVVAGLAALAMAAGMVVGFSSAAHRQGLEAVTSYRAAGEEGIPLAAREGFRRMARYSRFSAHAHYLLGTWEREYGDPEAAELQLQRAIALNPALAYYLDALARVLAAREREEEAIALLEQAATMEPFRPDGLFAQHRAELLLELGRDDQAIAALAEALAMNPRLAVSKPVVEMEERRPGLVRDALGSLEDLAGWIGPDHPASSRLLQRRLAQALQLTGRSAEAAAVLRRAGQSAPDDELALLALGHQLLSMGRLQETLDVLRAALARRPGEAVLRNELALALYLRGELGPAAAEFHRALADWSSPFLDNLIAHRYLLAIAQERGQAAEAEAERRKLRLLEPELGRQLWAAESADPEGASELIQIRQHPGSPEP